MTNINQNRGAASCHTQPSRTAATTTQENCAAGVVKTPSKSNTPPKTSAQITGQASPKKDVFVRPQEQKGFLSSMGDGLKNTWQIAKETGEYMTTKKYWGEVGTVLKGEAKGALGVVKGTVNAVAHPIDTAKGLANAVCNPVETAKNAWTGISKPFKEGNLEGMGEVVGATLASVAGPKALGATKSAVVGSRMTAAEIAAAGPALHLTKPAFAASIEAGGLHATQGLYKNLTTLGQPSVYMFGGKPNSLQKFVNFSNATKASTAEVLVDLTKLDPSKLYRRGLDGAITYRDAAGIPREALLSVKR